MFLDRSQDLRTSTEQEPSRHFLNFSGKTEIFLEKFLVEIKFPRK